MKPPPVTTEDQGALTAIPVAGESKLQSENENARIIGGVVFLLVLAWVFGRDVIALTRHAAGNEIHSHIILIPFISAYLTYIQWNQLPRQRKASWIPAILFALASVAALSAGRHLRVAASPISQNDYLSFVAFSLILALVAGGFMFFGAAWMKSNRFAAAFLLFGIPLPDHLVDVLETASKLGSAEVAHAFFNLSGTPIFREGLIFQIPGIAIEVAQECSGIRSSWVLLITSFLAAYMFLRSSWRRAVLVLLVIPLGLLRNGFRIWVIGLLCVHIGPEMIHSVIHKKGGPLFFAFSLIPLFFILWRLRKGEQRPSSGQEA